MKTNIEEGINEEKKKIIEKDGNLLVIANPGTGKTKLLVKKFAWLVLEKKENPEDILCLTFTNKVKREFEEKIIEEIRKEVPNFDISKLNVHTFHSYVLENLDEDEIVSSNLLRYSIYKYLKENEVLNYSDWYLINKIVPKMENLIRYLKSFGVTPDKINLEETKKYLQEEKNISKEELESFAEVFVQIFQYYEKIKENSGMDYSDILLKFFELNKIPKYKYLLIDELQDVNKIEAQIAIKSCENFIAVGDKKQSIFGFQGGSISNFEMFKNSTKFLLTENFRSENSVLDYSKEYFLDKVKEEGYKEELEELKNSESKGGEKPVIYESDKETKSSLVSEIIKNLEGNTAIITRTNGQVMKISEELKNRNIEHASTFVSASEETKENIVSFLKGVLGKDINDIKNSMFTPFFPIDIKSAFEIAEDPELNLEKIYKKSPGFKKIKESIQNIEDVKSLFEENIIPLSVSYGRECMLAAMNVRDAYLEAFESLENINLKNVLDFVRASVNLASESNIKKKLVVTTVHKAKGLEYDNVVYLPKKPNNKSNFQDRIVENILKTKGIDSSEELEEESLRVDFVAFTRAKKKLYIVTEKTEDYLNPKSKKENIEIESVDSFDVYEKNLKAYNLFLNGQEEKAKELLKEDNSWIKNFVREHFENLEKLSYSSLKEKPYDYMVNNILKLKDFSPAKNLGTEVHEIAERLVNSSEKDINIREELKPYKENIKELLEKIKKEYPQVAETEKRFRVPVSEILDTSEDVYFNGFIDAVFKNSSGEYLILDWKTDKKTDKAYIHRQQLEAYKNAYSIKENIPLEKIKIAIGFVGLKKTINTGEIESKLEDKQPSKSSFKTFSRKVNKILEWKSNPKKFWEELEKEKNEDFLFRRIIEQYKNEE